MQLLQRLSLFPIVFALPPATQQALPADYAQACVQCMAAAHALVQVQGQQVRLLSHSFGLSERPLLCMRRNKHYAGKSCVCYK
jgi:hypothetical protein